MPNTCHYSTISINYLEEFLWDTNGKWKVYNEYKNYLLARYYKPKVVEKHFSKISKLPRAEARQINNGLMTKFCLQQDIILSQKFMRILVNK